LRKLNRELEVARERADRALERLESRDAELGALNKQLQSERENGDKLRQERSRRIKIDREVREKGKELEDLRGEYVKLDGRLRDASQRGLAGGLDLAALRNLDPSRILGLTAPTTEEELSQIRRRFASVFHSDRSSQLPGWVSQLFDQLLSLDVQRDRARFRCISVVLVNLGSTSVRLRLPLRPIVPSSGRDALISATTTILL
jgi:hypothetical protein